MNSHHASAGEAPGDKLTIESLYANKITELWDLLEEYAKSSDKNSTPSLKDTVYTFGVPEPPFMPPRAIRERGLPISSIDIHVQRTLDDVGVEVIVEVDESDDFTFELTDTFGKEQYVRTDNNKILDRSQTTSLEVHEMLTNLALTRDEKSDSDWPKLPGLKPF